VAISESAITAETFGVKVSLIQFSQNQASLVFAPNASFFDLELNLGPWTNPLLITLNSETLDIRPIFAKIDGNRGKSSRGIISGPIWTGKKNHFRKETTYFVKSFSQYAERLK